MINIISSYEQYICRYCDKIYKNVHQFECGCRYCLECIEARLVYYQDRLSIILILKFF